MKKGMRNPLSKDERTIIGAQRNTDIYASQRMNAQAERLGKDSPHWVRLHEESTRLSGHSIGLGDVLHAIVPKDFEHVNNPLSKRDLISLTDYEDRLKLGLADDRKMAAWWKKRDIEENYRLWRDRELETQGRIEAYDWVRETFLSKDKDLRPGSRAYGEQMAPPEREGDDPNYWSQYNNPARRRTHNNPIHSLAHMVPPTSPHEFTSTHTLDGPWFPRNPVVARPGESFDWPYSSPPPNADVQHRAMTLPPKPRKGRPGFFRRVWNWLQTE